MTNECTKCTEKEEIIKFLENISLVLGITHGGISVILESPDNELRGKLTDLFQKLSKDISTLYYEPPKPSH